MEHTGIHNGISFKCTERGEGPPIILIPGTLGDSNLFEKLNLNGYKLYVFDHIHHSDLINVIDDFHSIFKEKLKLDKFILGGTSVGGWITQQYTNRFPEDIIAMILGNTFSDTKILRDQSLRLFRISKFVPWKFLRKMFLKSINSSFEELPKDKEYFTQSLFDMGKKQLRIRLSWSLSILSPLNISKEIPKMIIYTDDDTVVSMENTNLLIKSYPNALVLNLKVGDHYPYRATPEKYSKGILQFLEKINS